MCEIHSKKATQFSWPGSAATVVAVVISSAMFWGSAYAADKVGTMPMDSMQMQKSMMSGMKSMESMKSSGDTDHDFAMMMKMHHQSALDMANVELQHGKDPVLRNMAKAIIKSQTKEIKDFDKWLAKHPRPMMDAMPKSK